MSLFRLCLWGVWLLLCHPDNNLRPYHASQCLQGLTVILLPLTHCTDEQRSSMEAGEKDVEVQKEKRYGDRRRIKTPIQKERRTETGILEQSLKTLLGDGNEFGVLVWSRQRSWDRRACWGCQQSATLFDRWIRVLLASTRLKAHGHVTSGLALAQLKGGGGEGACHHKLPYHFPLNVLPFSLHSEPHVTPFLASKTHFILM